MRKWLRIVLAGVVIVVSFCGMVQFRQRTSAKETLREAGIRYYRMARYEDAADCFALALKQKEAFTERSDRDIYYYLADGERKQGDYASAVTYYEKLLQLGDKSAELYTSLGNCYVQQEKLEAAYECFQKAVAQKDADSSVYCYLSQLCQELGKSDECREYAAQGYAMAKEQNTEDIADMGTQTLSQYAQLAYLSGDYAAAQSDYEELNQRGDTHAVVYIGHCLAEQGDYTTALEQLTQYEQTYGNDPLAHAKRVYCHIQLKQYEQALTLADEALSMEEQALTQELLYEKGTALEQLGEFDAAFDCFAQYVEQYPDETKGKREYDFLVTRISDEKAAQAGVDNGNGSAQ